MAPLFFWFKGSRVQSLSSLVFVQNFVMIRNFVYLCGCKKILVMRKFLILTISWVITIGLMAQQIGIDMARGVAEKFFGATTTRSAAGVELAYTAESKVRPGVANLYVFSGGAGEYVIVSAEERTADVLLGHGCGSCLSYDDMPENMKWWIGEYVSQIDFLRDSVPMAAGSGSLKTATTKVVVPPLLGRNIWGQDEPYNQLTPTKKGVKAPTGCVATAMAQVMYYHKWPKKGTGKHTDSYDRTLTVNFSQSVYEWDKMLDSYGGMYSEEEADAVAKLMYDCGVAVDMQYLHNGKSSGAYPDDIAPALKKYFGYSTDVTYLTRDGAKVDWDGILTDELDNGRPVIYGGSDKSDGGHQFVCDGYEEMDGKILFHINWGWNGMYNGYFLSSVLDASSSMSFSLDQNITYGIHADSKVKAGGLYYSVLSESKVEVVAPDDTDEYAGKISVPSSVVIDGKTYDVVSIRANAFCGCTKLTDAEIPASVKKMGDYAFYGCSGLKNLTVNWTDGGENVPMFVCDEDGWNNVTVTVPEGCVDVYKECAPWMCFCHIRDTKGKTLDFSDWEKFEAGTGTYTYNTLYNDKKEDMPIFIATNKADENSARLRIDGWSDNLPLLMNYDKESCCCRVPCQYFTDINLSTGEDSYALRSVYASDMPSYDEEKGYDEFPCYYDPAAGIFTLNMVYFTQQEYVDRSVETFKMNGDYKDFSLSLGEVKAVSENKDMSASQVISFVMGKDVASLRYAVHEGWFKYESDAMAFAEGMASDSIESEWVDCSKTDYVTAVYPGPGKYVVVAITLDENGVYHGQYTTFEADYSYSGHWKYIGKGTYTESVIAELFGIDVYKYEVEVEQSITQGGRIRMKNPYGTCYPFNSDGTMSTYDLDSYIEIDVSDPDAVYIPMNQSMNLSVGTYGNCYIGSVAGYYLEEGMSVDEVKEMEVFGSLKDGCITFPWSEDEYGISGTLLTCIPSAMDYWNWVGADFMLDISGCSYTGVGSVKADKNVKSVTQEGVYDLAGRRVADSLMQSQSLPSGVYIMGGKKVVR